VQDLVTYLPPSTTLVENYPRFVSEYSLPEGAEDKLVTNADSYPEDHVATFAGNIDDAFRCGIKVTRKSAKIFAEFYQADVIVASPLGLRTSIEKDG
jgi:U3 small nucleolar RNA-associated protein 25